MRRSTTWVLTVCGWLVGCPFGTDDGSDEVSVERFENEGGLCFRSLADTGDERVVRVTASFPTCLSSSCSRRLGTACEVTRDGNTLRIESSGAAEHHGGQCTADCGSLAAECVSEQLPAGTYTVLYGTRTGTVTLPTDASGLFGENGGPLFCFPFPGGGSGGSGGAFAGAGGSASGGASAGAGGGGSGGAHAGAGGDGGSGGEGASCEDGEIVDSAADCLQDEAFCYELEDGRYCTGPATPMCPPGASPIAPDAECPEGSECWQYSESLRCVAPVDPVARCAPHDARYTGTCEPAPRYHWTGLNCVGRVGCECAGDDCAAGFASLEACESEYAGCADATVGCGGWLGNACGDSEYCAYVPELLCGAADASSICQPRPEGCDDQYEPVCGCDGTTYPNACMANLAGTGLSAYEACN